MATVAPTSSKAKTATWPSLALHDQDTASFCRTRSLEQDDARRGLHVCASWVTEDCRETHECALLLKHATWGLEKTQAPAQGERKRGLERDHAGDDNRRQEESCAVKRGVYYRARPEATKASLRSTRWNCPMT